MGIEDIEPDLLQLLAEEATSQGITLEKFVENLLVAEARRLWHIRRSQPRPPEPPKPPGRPPLTPEQKRMQELEREGIGVFVKLHRMVGEAEFERVYKEYQERFKRLVAKGDPGPVAMFLEKKPWMDTRKRV